MSADQVREELLSKNKTRKLAWSEKDLLGTGSTLLNLGISDNVIGGYAKGLYILFVGDSASGKTFFCLTCFAEAVNNPEFTNYRLIYDAVEGGALMDITRFFGPSVEERMEAPDYDEDGTPLYSQTVEEFYFNLDDILDGNQPCIYVLDSMDALTSSREQKKFDDNKKASAKGGPMKGDFSDGKAKTNSSGLRGILHKLRDTGSILIIINQTRDNVDGGMFAPQTTRSGGRALEFYASIQLWSSLGKTLKTSINGKDRVIGVTSRIKIKKNRLTGKQRTIEIPIKYDYGIDDLTSCIDYLIEEGRWKQKGSIVDPSADLTLKPKRKKNLIREIEEEGLEKEVQAAVAAVWKGIEDKCSEGRQPRYK